MDYTEGLAFILEGTTEKVFYKNLLLYLQSLDSKIVLQKEMEQMIKALDMDKIIRCSPLGLKRIVDYFI